MHARVGEHPNLERPLGLLRLAPAELEARLGLPARNESVVTTEKPSYTKRMPDRPMTNAALAGRDLSGEAVVLQRQAGLRFLAEPPTAAHPLRSKYARRQRYSIEFIWRVARGVCHAMAHLHKHKVGHGQLYAHGVLVDGEVRLDEGGVATTLHLALLRIEKPYE